MSGSVVYAITRAIIDLLIVGVVMLVLDWVSQVHLPSVIAGILIVVILGFCDAYLRRTNRGP